MLEHEVRTAVTVLTDTLLYLENPGLVGFRNKADFPPRPARAVRPTR
jgi:hypothetical protein